MPLHAYGVSKVAQDLLSYQYYVNDGIKVIRARLFNTTGPQKVIDAMSDFVRRAVEIKRGTSHEIRVGNLDTSPAITDVRDVVVALVLLAERGIHGEAYNVCGTRVYRIRGIVKEVMECIGVKAGITVDPMLLRPTDEKIILGDSSKLIRDTNWNQTYKLQTTITDMIDYWMVWG